MPASAGDGYGLPPAAQRAVRRRVTVPVRVVLTVLIVVSVVGVVIPTWLQYLPLVLSLVVFGLPHGALDHLVPARLSGRRPTWRSVARVVALYVPLGGATLALWAVAPSLAFVLFILLTWFHWGQGDLWAMLALDGAAHLRTRATRAAALLIRGALPMIVPLLTQGETYRLVADGASGVLSARSPVLLPLLRPAPGTVAACLTIFIVSLLLYGWVTRRAARHDPVALRDWRTDMLDTTLLTVFFAVVPAVFAIGLYFCAWHAVRHIVRLAGVDQANTDDLRAGDLLQPLRRFSRDALPITAFALILLGVLAPNSPPPADEPEQLLGV